MESLNSIDQRKIGLDEIERDVSTQTRLHIDSEKVDEYAEAMKEGAEFDPVITFYDGARYYLADGWHRMHAADQAGKNHIPAVVYQGTKRDAIWYALSANTKHGKPITNADKRKAVTIALGDSEWSCLSDTKIALHCGCATRSVGRIRKELDEQNVTMSQNSLSSKNGTPFANDSLSNNAPPSPSLASESYDEDEDEDEKLVNVDADRVVSDLAAQYKQVLTYFSKGKALLNELAADPDNGGHLAAKATRIKEHYELLRWTIRQTIPTEWCEGGSCKGYKVCKGTSFLTLEQVKREKERI